MIYVFDLDNTICTPGATHDTYNRYVLAKPIPQTIGRMRQLYAEGHTIIIHTARRMVTHNGDVDAIVADVGEVTVKWLEKHEVPYHQLVFGKPYGDYYVDDKAVRPDEIL